MSISGSLSNALSGLTASARAADLVSSNVANAMTEGYGRRELMLSSRTVGGGGAGVQVTGVTRVVDQILLRDRRLADAGVANADVQARFLSSLEGLVGTPGQPGSLSARLSALEGALIEATSRPDLDTRLQAVVTTATELTGALNAASAGVQRLRVDADAAIAQTVDRVNRTLEQVAEINQLILRNGGPGRDVSGLEDQRQILVDGLAEVVPLRLFTRDNGTVAIYTSGGAVLLDGKPSVLAFSPAAIITPDMTLSSGAVSGLSVNGTPVPTSGAALPFAGGRLAALFDLRDGTAVLAQARLDAVARDLIERVTDPAVDPTLAPGAPGLLTDRGSSFDPAVEVGLAGRIAVSVAVNPAAGAELWRLRDGIGAATPGPVGSGSALASLAAALAAPRILASGDLSGAARSAEGVLGDLASRIGGDIRTTDAQLGYATAQRDSLRAIELAGGVDTDQEMQKLLLIEQTYAANAQVIRTADELIQILLGL